MPLCVETKKKFSWAWLKVRKKKMINFRAYFLPSHKRYQLLGGEVLSYSPLYQLLNFFQRQERMIGRCFHIPEDALSANFTMFPCATDPP